MAAGFERPVVGNMGTQSLPIFGPTPVATGALPPGVPLPNTATLVYPPFWSRLRLAHA
jgi:hypothetical protein